MNRNDRQTFALLLVQVAVVLPKGSGRGGGSTTGEGVLLLLRFSLRFQFGSVQFGSLEWVVEGGRGCRLEMHFHCIHFGGFHYVAKVLHLFLVRTLLLSLSAASCFVHVSFRLRVRVERIQKSF